MSELDDLVAVFGRIDDAVVEDPSLQPKVAAMLPLYGQDASGWYRALQDFQAIGGNPQLAELHDVGSALDSLEEFSAPLQDDYEGWATRHWLTGRRLLAGATLSRIQGSIDLPSGADPRAIVRGIAAPVDGDSSGHQLHSHLRRAGEYPDITAWSQMMEGTRQRVLVNRQFENATYLPPITWAPDSFRAVHSPSTGTSVALRTHIHVEDLNLDQASECLNPDNWSKYRPPWCEMNLLGNTLDIQRYQEVISANCGPGSKLTTVLDFRCQDLGDRGGILEYRIPDGPRLPQTDGLVTIDEGSLEIRPAKPPNIGVHFVSTKRIQFEALRAMPTMTAAGLGFLVWVLGWDSLAERFIYFLAREQAPTVVRPTSTPPQAGAFPPASPSDGGITTMLNLGISGWQNYLRNCVNSVRSSTQRASAGSYGLADYFADLTKVSNEVTTNTMAIASLGVQMWRSVSDSTPEGGGGSGSGPGQPSGGQPEGPGPAAAAPVKQAAKKAPVKRAAKKAPVKRAAKKAPVKRAAKKAPVKRAAKKPPVKRAARRVGG